MSAGDISFTGTFRNSDISRTLSTGGNGFNFAGNPFASYTDIASMLTTNSGILDEETIWLWNQATASYDTKVTADAYKLAPGQAFFIKSMERVVHWHLIKVFKLTILQILFKEQKIDLNCIFHFQMAQSIKRLKSII